MNFRIAGETKLHGNQILQHVHDLEIQELEKKLRDSTQMCEQAQERITQLANMAERKMLLVEKCMMILRGAARYHGYATVELYIKAMDRRGGSSKFESVAKSAGERLRVEALLDDALETLERLSSEQAMSMALEPLEALFQDALTQTSQALKLDVEVQTETGDHDHDHNTADTPRGTRKLKWGRASVFGGQHARRNTDEQAMPRLDEDELCSRVGSDIAPVDSGGSFGDAGPRTPRKSVLLGESLQPNVYKGRSSSIFGSLRHGLSSMVIAKAQVPASPLAESPEPGSDDDNSDDADMVLPISPRRPSLLSLTGAMTKRRSSLDSLASNGNVPMDQLLRQQRAFQDEQRASPREASTLNRRWTASASPAEIDRSSADFISHSRQGGMPVLLRGRPKPKLAGICAE